MATTTFNRISKLFEALFFSLRKILAFKHTNRTETGSYLHKTIAKLELEIILKTGNHDFTTEYES